MLTAHLLRLLELRDFEDRSLGVKRLHLGVVEDPMAPERFFVAGERQAVVPTPSLTSHEAFDSGVELGAAEARRLLDHGRQAYAVSRRVETRQQVNDLPVLRMREDRP
ncbi:hypothetical protein [Nonomuraea angiospora]